MPRVICPTLAPGIHKLTCVYKLTYSLVSFVLVKMHFYFYWIRMLKWKRWAVCLSLEHSREELFPFCWVSSTKAQLHWTCFVVINVIYAMKTLDRPWDWFVLLRVHYTLICYGRSGLCSPAISRYLPCLQVRMNCGLQVCFRVWIQTGFQMLF